MAGTAAVAPVRKWASWHTAREASGRAWAASPGRTSLAAVMRMSSAFLGAASIFAAHRATSMIGEAGFDRAPVATLLAAVGLFFVTSVTTFGMSLMNLSHKTILDLMVGRSLHDDLITASTAVDLERYDDPSFYDLVSRARTVGIEKVAGAFGSGLDMASALLGLVVAAAALVAIQWLLVPLLLLGAVVLILVGKVGLEQAFTSLRLAAALFRRSEIVEDIVTIDRSAAKEVRSYEAAGLLRRRFLALYDETFAVRRRQVRLTMALEFVTFVVLGAFVLLWAALILALERRGSIDGPDIAAAAVSLTVIVGALSRCAGAYKVLRDAALQAEELREIQAFVTSPPSGAAVPLPSAPAVRASGLAFRYPGAETDALSGVDLHLEAGTMHALVGHNGSGKTTLAKLLAGLYTPTAGTVDWTAGGVTAAERRTATATTSITFQDFVRYPLSLHENIAIGRPDRIDDRDGVMRAATAAGVTDFVDDLPGGYDALLTKELVDGTELSGGQWQRVALARAFFRDAPMVILDEPTSALDPLAEVALLSDVRSLFTDRTVVLISHRLWAVKDCTRIHVMAGGRIVEHGTHEELVALGGAYAEMWAAQAGLYSEPA